MERIKLGARPSPLSLVQIEEIKGLLPSVQFEVTLVETEGDVDKTTSLREMGQTDFFTKEIDLLVANGVLDVGIHSAKDLPENLMEGLEVFAITKGLDPRDSVVLRKGETLIEGARIGASSKRREDRLKAFGQNFQFKDIRGNIGERLKLLEEGEIDGLIVAEAALIRLGLTHLNRIILSGETAPLQGKLAVVGRKGDREKASLFGSLNTNQRLFNFGITKKVFPGYETIHLPLVRIEPIDPEEVDLDRSTHLLFTSKTAVSLFKEKFGVRQLPVLAIGRATSVLARDLGFLVVGVATDETSEGVLALLEKMGEVKSLFWPRSEGARSVIKNFCLSKGIDLQDPPFYRVKPNLDVSLPPFLEDDNFFFSSPSTVSAFFSLQPIFPKTIRFFTQGLVTQKELEKHTEASCFFD